MQVLPRYTGSRCFAKIENGSSMWDAIVFTCPSREGAVSLKEGNSCNLQYSRHNYELGCPIFMICIKHVDVLLYWRNIKAMTI